MTKDKLVLTPIEEGILISLGTIFLGNLIKNKQKDVGNFLQGIGIGALIGTIAHKIDEKHPSDIPHHDAIALASMPIIFIIDKTNIMKDKDIVNNLYGMSIGVLSEHLIGEGCSICKSKYCSNGDKLC
jgi:hypothetical protein